MPGTNEDADELANRIRTHAVVSDTTDPAADPDELAAFGDGLADVAVVGMGEATHRTREIVRFQHRLVRHLATERGLRLYGLEAPFSETAALNEYVLRGRGDVESALDEIGYSIHSVEEVAALFRWMRRFNEDRPPEDRIAVYGFDIQSAAGAADALLAFFDDLPGEESPPDATLRSLDAVSGGVFEGADVDEDLLATAEDAVSDLRSWFDPPYEGTPREQGPDIALAYQHLRTLARACEFARTGLNDDRPAQWGLRDRYMAETVEWVLEYEQSDTIALRAHNNHVKRGELSGDGAPSATMGDHLARTFDGGYYALGTQFGRGSVRAFVPDDDGEITIDGRRCSRKETAVPDPIEGSVPETFAAVGDHLVVVDYGSLPGDDPLRSWLDGPRPHHYVAGDVDPADPRSFYRSHDSTAAFDGLAFVGEATPTTPL